MRRALRRAGDRTVLTDAGGAARTGAQLADRVARLAGALAGRGLAGRRIGLWYQNSIAAFEAFLAVEQIGATRLPVEPASTAPEARAIFDAGQADAVLADSRQAARLGGDVLIHDDQAPLLGPALAGERAVAADTPLVVYPRQVAGGQLFAVTTSYANWDAIMRVNCELYRRGWYGPGFGAGERLLTVQQLMHGTGMVASFPFLLMGLPQVVLPGFGADAVLDAVRRHQITATFTVPGMLTRLADRLGGAAADLPLRHTLYGGAPVPAGEIRRLRTILGQSLVQLYGRFEAGWPLAVLGVDEHTAILNGDDHLGTSCGRPIPQVDIRIAGVPGQPPGHGELQTRSPMVSPAFADPEGWCGLGDLAYRDSRGYLHLTGRLDGMINTGSYHVYPGQVEEVIASVPGVAAVRVTGEPDPVWGQAVTAYVIPDDPAAWSGLTQRLAAELSARLARYKIPKAIHKVTALP
jgi:acyl-CoA synthetase (AMP-forming)/AMP-acid ligase II